ncbi:MAG: hypothetical protein AB8G86_12120 [Saprospiraceae bacterium]
MKFSKAKIKAQVIEIKQTIQDLSKVAHQLDEDDKNAIDAMIAQLQRAKNVETIST